MTTRGRLTEKQKRELLKKQGNRCKACGALLIAGLFQFDHIQDLQHRGDNLLDNWQILCTAPPARCHQNKTKRGNAARLKADRIALGGRERKGPPMDGSRDSPFRKRMNGTTERR